MSFISLIKRAFGFGNDSEIYDDEDTSGIDATVIPLNKRSRSTHETTPSDTDANDAGEEIRNSISESIKPTIDSLLDIVAQSVEQTIESRMASERINTEHEIDELRRRIHDNDNASAEKDRQKLSAERQRRAMGERVHDLESQIVNLQAEIEQLQLENHTLVNKMRVISVRGDATSEEDVDAMAAILSKHEEEKAELQARIDSLTAEIDAAKNSTEMSQTMFNDLNQRASAARQELAERDNEIAELRSRLASTDDTNTDLRKELNDALGHIESLKQELNEAHSNLEIAAQIQDQVEKIQEIIKKKNAKIADLSTELRRRDDRINALEQEEQALHKTIENNLIAQAQSETDLRAQIETLQQQIALSKKNKNKGAKTCERSNDARETEISAIDPDLDSTDWLVSTPPEGTTIKTSGVSDNEFGYQEPPQKPLNDSPAQMSLW